MCVAALEFPADPGPLGRNAGDAYGAEHSLPAAFSGIAHMPVEGHLAVLAAWCPMLSWRQVFALEACFASLGASTQLGACPLHRLNSHLVIDVLVRAAHLPVLISSPPTCPTLLAPLYVISTAGDAHAS